MPNDPLVLLDPSIAVELRYATPRNITGRAFYPENAKAYLRVPAAESLVRVDRRLRAQGFRLKVWDPYRPATMQQRLWDACPDAQYVCPPEVGSKHSRGCAVDLTMLVLATDAEAEMPTDHDVFTQDAWSKSTIPSPTARKNRDILHAAMIAEGWKPVEFEWWHFDWPGWRDYPLSDEPIG